MTDHQPPTATVTCRTYWCHWNGKPLTIPLTIIKKRVASVPMTYCVECLRQMAVEVVR